MLCNLGCGLINWAQVKACDWFQIFSTDKQNQTKKTKTGCNKTFYTGELCNYLFKPPGGSQRTRRMRYPHPLSMREG